MQKGDIVGHGLHPNRIGYIASVEHGPSGQIITYNVVWINGAWKGKEHTISAYRVNDMQEALESARAEVAKREADLIKWRHAATMMKMGIKTK